MVDQEVVDILAEIKQRVVSAKSPEPTTHASANGTSTAPPMVQSAVLHDYAALAILDRSWDRLPPLVTNRTGTAARIDLWIKAKMKTAFRWFTWEQINFNAATLQTFKELIESLALQQRQLASIQSQLVSYEQQLQDFHQKLDDEVDSVRDETQQVRAALHTLSSTLNTYEANFGVLRALLTSQQADVNAKLETLASQSASDVDELKKGIELKANETQVRLKEVVRELSERHEQILDEQRVSFKQLSLELSEAQVLQDRARRELDSRVAKLEVDR